VRNGEGAAEVAAEVAAPPRLAWSEAMAHAAGELLGGRGRRTWWTRWWYALLPGGRLT
jgi:hypothetical protein